MARNFFSQKFSIKKPFLNRKNGKVKFYLNFLSLFLFYSFFEIFPIENCFINLQHCATNFVAPKNTKKNFNLRWPTLTNVNQRWLKFGQT